MQRGTTADAASVSESNVLVDLGGREARKIGRPLSNRLFPEGSNEQIRQFVGMLPAIAVHAGSEEIVVCRPATAGTRNDMIHFQSDIGRFATAVLAGKAIPREDAKPDGVS